MTGFTEPSGLYFCLRWCDASKVEKMKQAIESFYGSQVTAFDVIITDISVRNPRLNDHEVIIDFALSVVHRHLNWDTTEKLIRLRLQEFATELDIVIQF